jgi:predicted nucleic acid-binding protein
MSAVVADTSPLNYLLLIGEVEVLPALFGEIIIPAAVMAEFQHPNAPSQVAQWGAAPPGWARVMSAAMLDPDIRLGAGETEAISLAVELGLAAVLMDERKGRAAAEARGLIAVGTLNPRRSR